MNGIDDEIEVVWYVDSDGPERPVNALPEDEVIFKGYQWVAPVSARVMRVQFVLIAVFAAAEAWLICTGW